MLTDRSNHSLTALPAFRITKSWLKQHGTGGCGWNREQILALGLEYPPPSGWTREIAGRAISMAQKHAFEAAAKSPAVAASPVTGFHCALKLLGAHAKLASMRAVAGGFLAWLADVLPRLDASSTAEQSLQVIGEIAERLSADVEAHCEAAGLPPPADADRPLPLAEPARTLDASPKPRRLARVIEAKAADIAPNDPASPRPLTPEDRKHQQELAECRARSAERHREQRRQSAERRRMLSEAAAQGMAR